MLNFETGKIKLISNTSFNGAPVELSGAVQLIIRNSDTGLYWDDNDAFVSGPFTFTLPYDSVAKYYYYTNTNLVLLGFYEAIFIYEDVEMQFREVEQFLVIPVLFDESTIATAVWDHIIEGTFSALHYMRLMAASLFGKSDATQGPGRVVYRDTLDTKDRIDALHSTDGDRTSVTLDED